jgi:hypothetical protein
MVLYERIIQHHIVPQSGGRIRDVLNIQTRTILNKEGEVLGKKHPKFE